MRSSDADSLRLVLLFICYAHKRNLNGASVFFRPLEFLLRLQRHQSGFSLYCPGLPSPIVLLLPLCMRVETVPLASRKIRESQRKEVLLISFSFVNANELN